MIKINTPKQASEFVRNLVLPIYIFGSEFPARKIPCMRTYSESYNNGKSWRYKWYYCDYTPMKNDAYERMVDYTNKILKPRIQALFKMSVQLKWNGKSLTLLTKPVK